MIAELNLNGTILQVGVHQTSNLALFFGSNWLFEMAVAFCNTFWFNICTFCALYINTLKITIPCSIVVACISLPHWELDRGGPLCLLASLIHLFIHSYSNFHCLPNGDQIWCSFFFSLHLFSFCNFRTSTWFISVVFQGNISNFCFPFDIYILFYFNLIPMSKK